MMKRLPFSRLISTLLLAVFVLGMTPARAAAEDRLIVRAGGLLGGLPVVKSACRILGCNVLYALDGTLNNVLLVAVPDVLDTQLLVRLLSIVKTPAGISITVPGLASINCSISSF